MLPHMQSHAPVQNKLLAGIDAGLHLQNCLLKALLASHMQRKGSIQRYVGSICFAGKKARRH